MDRAEPNQVTNPLSGAGASDTSLSAPGPHNFGKSMVAARSGRRVLVARARGSLEGVASVGRVFPADPGPANRLEIWASETHDPFHDSARFPKRPMPDCPDGRPRRTAADLFRREMGERVVIVPEAAGVFRITAEQAGDPFQRPVTK